MNLVNILYVEFSKNCYLMFFALAAALMGHLHFLVHLDSFTTPVIMIVMSFVRTQYGIDYKQTRVGIVHQENGKTSYLMENPPH